MKGFWAMLVQLCSQAVRVGGGGDGDGVGGDGRGLGLLELLIMPLEPVLRCLIPLASEVTTKKLKTEKARKVITLEVFMVDFCCFEVKREARYQSVEQCDQQHRFGRWRRTIMTLKRTDILTFQNCFRIFDLAKYDNNVQIRN
jgi:hypothetical protein